MPANSLIFAALCALSRSPLHAQPKLDIELVGASVAFRVAYGDQIFLGRAWQSPGRARIAWERVGDRLRTEHNATSRWRCDAESARCSAR
jgi:hypothetical protein